MIRPLFVALLSYIFIKILINNADKLSLVDIPNERSHHKAPIPRGGGIGFVSAAFLGVIFFHMHIFLENWFVFLSILLVFLVGIIDDRYSISAKLKFVAIFIAVFVLWLNNKFQGQFRMALT